MTSETTIERCVSTCAEHAWRLAYALVWNPDDAREVVQQAFLVATVKQRQIPTDDCWPWFRQVLTLEALKLREARAKRARLRAMLLEQPAMTPTDPATEAADHDLNACLHAALQALSSELRDALCLTQIGGMTVRDAAQSLGVSSSTLDRRVQEGLAQLRRKLGVPETAIGGSLMALPFAPPPEGMAQAVQGWLAAVRIESSLIGAGSATGVKALGGTLVAKYAAVTLTLIVVGLLLWMFVLKPGAESPGREANRLARGEFENGTADPARAKARPKGGGLPGACAGSVKAGLDDPAAPTGSERGASSTEVVDRDGDSLGGHERPLFKEGWRESAPISPAEGPEQAEMSKTQPALRFGGAGPWDNGRIVSHLSTCPDGVRFVTADPLRLWDIRSGKIIRELTGEPTDGLVNAFAFTPDGRGLIVGYSRGLVRLWNTDTGENRVLPLGETGVTYIASVACSPDGRWLAAAEGSALYVWDAATIRRTARIETEGARIRAMAFVDEKNVVAAGANLQQFDIGAGSVSKIKDSFEDISKVNFGFRFSPDGRYVAFATGERHLVVLGSKDGTVEHDFNIKTNNTPMLETQCLIWTRDGRELLTAGHMGAALRDLNTGVAKLNFEFDRGDPITAIDITPDGSRVLTAGERGIIRILDAVTGKRIIDLSPALDESIHNDINGLAFSADGRTLAVTDGGLTLWDVHSGVPRARLKAAQGVQISTMLPDNKRALVWHEGYLEMLDLEDGRVVREFRGDLRNTPCGAAVSPDGQWLVVCDGRIGQLWNLAQESSKPVRTIQGMSWLSRYAISPDGNYIVSSVSNGARGRVRVWKVNSDMAPIEIQPGDRLGPCIATFSPDGRSILLADRDGSLKLYDSTSGSRTLSLVEGAGVNSSLIRAATFTPDGAAIVVDVISATSKLAGLHLISATSGKLLQSFEVTTGVAAMALSPDGRTLAVAGKDRTIRVWDVDQR